MIITDDFVYIHFPKTGGTFVSKVLTELYQYKRQYKILKSFPKTIKNNINNRYKIQLRGFIELGIGEFGQHAPCHQIPEEHRNKPILTNIRNPYDRYVSHYEYQWWKRRPEDDFEFYTLKDLKEKCPKFPDLDFEEYLNLWNSIWLPDKIKKRANIDLKIEKSFGLETYNFIEFYFKNPPKVIHEVYHNYQNYTLEKKYNFDMFNDIHFLKMDQLNSDLYNFLLNLGWKKNEISFILNSDKILPPGSARTKEQTWQRYYTPELKDLIRQKDKFIFEIFPEFDV